MIIIDTGELKKLTWNTQEDWLLKIGLADAKGVVLPVTTPFRLHFFGQDTYDKYAKCRTVAETDYYVVSYDGTEYTNCYVDTDGVLWAKFENHNLCNGSLYATQILIIDNAEYSDTTLDIANVYKLPITMSRVGVTSTLENDVIIRVLSPIYKGEDGKSITYDDLTDDQKAELRGVKWVGDISDFNDFLEPGDYGVVSNNNTLNRPTDGFHNWSLEVLIKSSNWVIQRATRRDEGDTMLTYIRELGGSISSAWVAQNSSGGSSITIDPEPTEGSKNAVSSGGVYNAIDQSLGNVGAYLATI